MGLAVFISSSAHGTTLFLLIWRRLFLHPFLAWTFSKFIYPVQPCFYPTFFLFVRSWMTHFQIVGEWHIYLCQKELDQCLTDGGKIGPSIWMTSGFGSWRGIKQYKKFQVWFSCSTSWTLFSPFPKAQRLIKMIHTLAKLVRQEGTGRFRVPTKQSRISAELETYKSWSLSQMMMGGRWFLISSSSGAPDQNLD